mmetsp:Transcript_20039/g.80308  ORF Transcript_20039/g.80308 Transcript_20039/m.80308 type:complete len:106 (-) Transcript_20039:3626-3943(-)
MQFSFNLSKENGAGSGSGRRGVPPPPAEQTERRLPFFMKEMGFGPDRTESARVQSRREEAFGNSPSIGYKRKSQHCSGLAPRRYTQLLSNCVSTRDNRLTLLLFG